jgi:hypothetical protein
VHVSNFHLLKTNSFLLSHIRLIRSCMVSETPCN